MEPRTESAEFAPRPIARRRGGVPVALGLWVLAIGALVAVGSLDRLTDHSSAPAVVPGSVAPLAVVAAAQGPASERPDPTATLGVLRVDARRDGSHLFVHGAALSRTVVWVVVSLQDERGRAAEFVTIKLPGGSTAFRIGAETRFDAHMLVPDELLDEPTWLVANAYTVTGFPIGTAGTSIAGGPTVRRGLAGRDSVGIRSAGDEP